MRITCSEFLFVLLLVGVTLAPATSGAGWPALQALPVTALDPLSDSEIVLADASLVSVGDRYALVDRDGYIADVVIDRIEWTTFGCDQGQRPLARVRVNSPVRSSYSADTWTFAVGPLASASPKRARVMVTPAPRPRDLPPGLKEEDYWLEHTIDLDGDRKPEFASFSPKKKRSGDPFQLDYARRAGTWTRLTNTGIGCQ